MIQDQFVKQFKTCCIFTTSMTTLSLLSSSSNGYQINL